MSLSELRNNFVCENIDLNLKKAIDFKELLFVEVVCLVISRNRKNIYDKSSVSVIGFL